MGSLLCGRRGFCRLSEKRSDSKVDAFAGRQVDGSPTANGFDGPGRDRRQFPGAKADQAHLIALCDFLADGLDQRINHHIGLFYLHLGFGCNQMGEVLFANNLCFVCCCHTVVDPFSKSKGDAGLPAHQAFSALLLLRERSAHVASAISRSSFSNRRDTTCLYTGGWRLMETLASFPD